MSPNREVAMRPPEVFVRELSPEEGMKLRSISRRAKYQSKRERATIVLASATGMSAPQIAELVRTDDSHVRKVIHAFNEEGFDSLDPDYRGGRPKKTTPTRRDRIVAVGSPRIARARARPCGRRAGGTGPAARSSSSRGSTSRMNREVRRADGSVSQG